MKKKLLIVSLVLSVVLLIGALGFYWSQNKALGNASNTIAPCQTSSATTSPNYITAGRATGTLIHDAYTNVCDKGSSAQNPTLADKAVLNVYFTASSSALSTLNMNLQISENGNDWFPYALATTTAPLIGTLSINVAATSTPDYTACSPASCLNGATTTRAVIIQTPLRYLKVFFTVPIGSEASAYWAEIRGQKERQ